MDENTTTEEPVVTTGAEEALPVETTETAADNSAAEEKPNEDTGGEPAKATDSLPDDLRSFAKGQGIEDVENLSEREVKLLKIAKDNQAEYQRTRQKESQLEKTVQTTAEETAREHAEATGQDPELLERVARIETSESVRTFWATPLPTGQIPDRSLETAMVQQLESKPHLAGDLESLYASALLSSGAINSAQSQGGKAALQKLAHNQQAAVPTGHATTRATPQEKPFAELSIPEMEAKLGYHRA